MTIKKPGRNSLVSHGRLAFSAQPQKLNLPLLVDPLLAAAIQHHESRPLKKRCFERSRSLLLWFFPAKDICTTNFTFTFTFIYIWNHVRSVSFSDGGSHDRDIIFRDRRYLGLNLFPWLFWWSFRHAKLTAGGEARDRIPAIEFVCFFFFSFLLLAFLHDQTHILTQTRDVRAKRRGKVERRHCRAVRFTRFVDYRLMFDSWRSIRV